MEQHNRRRMREKRSKAFVSLEWFYIYNDKICINVLYKYICIYIHIYTLRYLYIPWDICFINKVCPCGGTTISSGLKSVIPHIRSQNIFELSIFLYLNVKMKPFYTKKPLKGVPKKYLVLISEYKNWKSERNTRFPLEIFFKDYG